MSVCVSTDNQGDLVLVTSPCDYILLDPVEYDQVINQSSGGVLSLPVDDPAVNELIGGIILLFTLAYVFRQILNSIRGNNS